MRGVIALVFATAASLWSAAASARDEPRVALVIGIQDYDHVAKLQNPISDADLIAGALTDIGFDVQLLENPVQIDMEDAIINLGRRIEAAGPDTIALFYYAGHAVQSAGINYLIPRDAIIDAEDKLATRAVEANWIAATLQTAGAAANVVILDACRDNPFLEAWPSSTRSTGSRGLLQLEPPRGSLLMFSTAPGDVALDGDGSNSPFAEVLAEHIGTPNLRAESMFVDVVAGVVDATGGVQNPWLNFSLRGEFYLGGHTDDGADEPDELLTSNQFEEMYWDLIADSTDPDDFRDYLDNFPDGQFVDEANAKLAELAPESAPEDATDVAATDGETGGKTDGGEGETVTGVATTSNFRVIEAAMTAEPVEYAGRCPATVNFRGRVSAVGGSGLVSYRFVRSDGAAEPIANLVFDEPGTHEVATSWTLGAEGDRFEGWVALEIYDPEEMASERTPFSVSCARQRDPSDTGSGSRYVIPDRVAQLVTDTATRPAATTSPATSDTATLRVNPNLTAISRERLAARLAARNTQTPTLRAPADNETFNIYPRTMTFTWEPVSGAQSYVLEVDAYGMCQAGAWCADVGGRTFQRPNLTRPTYTYDFVGAQPGRWRVWAVFEGGREGPKSEWRNFRHLR